jgi:HEAT repeat protein
MARVVLVGLVGLLAGCGSSLSTEDCLRQLQEGDVARKRQAIRELGSRPEEAERAVPALVEALRDENGYVRRDAAYALGKLGAEAKSAVPALLAARKGRERSVRKAVDEALKKIDPGAAAKAGVR